MVMYVVAPIFHARALVDLNVRVAPAAVAEINGVAPGKVSVALAAVPNV
jgi:hypothetical protein